MEMKTAVVEGRWWRNQNVSIKPLFDLISDLTTETPHSYHYETFGNGDSLCEILGRLSRQKNGIQHIYIASHGGEKGLLGADDKIITFDFITESLKGTSFKSIFFGSCLMGRDKLARKILENCPNLNWVAGYSTKVDWIESSAMDFIYWYQLALEVVENPAISPVELRECLSNRMSNMFPIACMGTGFEMFVRKNRLVDGIVTEECIHSFRDIIKMLPKEFAEYGITCED